MQTMNLKSAKVLGALFLLLLGFTACKKDEVPTPVPQPALSELSIKFSNETIPMTDIDSVVVIIRDQHQFVKKWETMERASASFKTNLQGLVPGNYKAEILAFSKKRADLTARQFKVSKDIVLPLAQSVEVPGPNGSFHDEWYQRAVFFERQGDAIVIVAMDPRDSYYQLSFKAAIGKRIHLQRYSIDVNALVASKTTARNIEGSIGITEYWDFVPYVELMNGKSWTKGVITIFFTPGRSIVCMPSLLKWKSAQSGEDHK